MINTLLSSALNDLKISHEEFSNIKNAYEDIKENIKNINQEIILKINYKNHFKDFEYFINFKDFTNYER